MKPRNALIVFLIATFSVLLSPMSASAVIPGADPVDIGTKVGVELGRQAVAGCTIAPPVQSPTHGAAGAFARPPVVIPPADANPFTEGSSWTVFEVYGFGGTSFEPYDLGCIANPQNAGEMIGAYNTDLIVDMMMLPAEILLPVTAAFIYFVFHPREWLSVFDPLVVTVTNALHEEVWLRFVIVIVAGVAIGLLWKARESTRRSISGVIWVITVMFIVTALFRWPVEASRATDESTTVAASAIANGVLGDQEAQDPATTFVGNVYGVTKYDMWRGGMFGCVDCPVADKYGPLLVRWGAFSWAEQVEINEDPERRAAIVQMKNEGYRQTMEALKTEYPDVYPIAQGKDRTTRISYAAMSGIGVSAITPYLLACCVLIFGSYIVMRLGVMFSPVIGTIGIIPKLRDLVVSTGTTMAAAVINSVVFVTITVVVIKVVTTIIRTDETQLPVWFALVIAVIFSWVMWKATKPFRKLTQMVSARRFNPLEDLADSPGDVRNEVGRKWRKARRSATRLVSRAAGNAIGGVAAEWAVGDKKNSDDDDKSTTERTEARPYDGEIVTPTRDDRSPFAALWAAPETVDGEEVPNEPDYFRPALPVGESEPNTNPYAREHDGRRVDGSTPISHEPRRHPETGAIIVEPTARRDADGNYEGDVMPSEASPSQVFNAGNASHPSTTASTSSVNSTFPQERVIDGEVFNPMSGANEASSSSATQTPDAPEVAPENNDVFDPSASKADEEAR